LGYRHDADELKQHKFFRNIDWNILKEKRYHAPMKLTFNSELDVSQFSEDFTNQPAVDGPAESGPLTASNGHNFFKGTHTYFNII
jgi:Protein kinase C terminal domain